jgi:hypothetical protein
MRYACRDRVVVRVTGDAEQTLLSYRSELNTATCNRNSDFHLAYGVMSQEEK